MKSQRTREQRLATRAKADQTVYNNGVAARAAGETEDACPYHDVRKLDGRLTFSRAWRRIWLKGFRGQPQ